ncbi:MAG TPA: UDP-N-acetylmuramoyl-tripeptide--D-alanyl-D-alanine ligase, partial [Chitinivibrionales bacterium]|nr:UDP-N-acetylmuramoyl-tripeptide--D-alanyl-D-alanine ligase [Chitinivibrionales bacterium]
METSARQAGPGLTLGRFAAYSGGETMLSEAALAEPLKAVWNDSRNVTAGDVFVAIQTETDDGHKYVKNALDQGAVAALVAKKKLAMVPESLRERLIAVADPLTSLQSIASQYRATFPCTMVGITGSSGKTTARSFVSAVLRQSLDVSETQGNWNNHIGVPLCLLRFTGKEDAGVLEMGANHSREIHTLSAMVRPDIGIIMNIGYAHIGYFGSLANIAKAKFEIVDGMKKSGTLLLNGDDPVLVKMARTAGVNVEFFGTSGRCSVRASGMRLTDAGHTAFVVDGEEFELPMPGMHFVYSALAAVAVARRFDIDKGRINAAFSALKPGPLRGTIEKKAGATFVVDCYNANPSSMKSGIELLCAVAGESPTVAIVGDMLELGKFSARLHVELGRQLAAAHVKRILAVGEYASAIAKGAIEGGMARKNILTAPDSSSAAPMARALVKSGDVVLLKGSRGVHLETVYEGLGAAEESSPAPRPGLYPKSYVPRRASIIGAAKS